MAENQYSTPAVRGTLAYIVLGIGGAAVMVLGYVAIKLSAPDDRAEMTKYVLAAALPLLGTWVGTVLAFYFGRDNAVVAQQNALQTLRTAQGGETPSTSIVAVMQRVDQIKAIRHVADPAAARELMIDELEQDMRQFAVGRVPVISSTGVAMYVVRDEDIQRLRSGNQAADKLGALLDDSRLRASLQGFVTVDERATVADARSKLAVGGSFKDVFVTRSGLPDGTVLGWVTDTDLGRLV